MTEDQKAELAWANQEILQEGVAQLKRIADALESSQFTDRVSDSIYNAVTQAALGMRR